MPVALTIAGSDPCGGAGIQADLKTFHQFGVYGEAVIALLTVQNTQRVERVDCVPAELVSQQLRAVIEDIPPDAAKTGALGSAEIVEAVAAAIQRFDFPLVVDPVMVSKHGLTLMNEQGREAMKRHLIPRAFLVTPNLPEASALTGVEILTLADMCEAAKRLCGMGARAALVKGGHLEGSSVDVLCDGTHCFEFPAERLNTPHTHGTGCTFSAAITAELARGAPLQPAVRRAKAFITEAIRSNPALGHGSGPVNHHARLPQSTEVL